MNLKLPPPMQLNFNLPVGSATNIGGPELSGYLTPDSLMAYCETRLRGLDDQMQKAFADQQKSNAVQEMLSGLQGLAVLGAPEDTLDLSMKGNSGWPNKPADFQKVQGAYDAIQERIKQLDPRDPMVAKLTKIADSLGSMKSGSFIPAATSISPQQWNTEITEALSSTAKDLSSSSELSMIQLQSLMSQRQEAIQMCTNLVQSLGDQCNKIAENVGH